MSETATAPAVQQDADLHPDEGHDADHCGQERDDRTQKGLPGPTEDRRRGDVFGRGFRQDGDRGCPFGYSVDEALELHAALDLPNEEVTPTSTDHDQAARRTTPRPSRSTVPNRGAVHVHTGDDPRVSRARQRVDARPRQARDPHEAAPGDSIWTEPATARVVECGHGADTNADDENNECDNADPIVADHAANRQCNEQSRSNVGGGQTQAGSVQHKWLRRHRRRHPAARSPPRRHRRRPPYDPSPAHARATSRRRRSGSDRRPGGLIRAR